MHIEVTHALNKVIIIWQKQVFKMKLLFAVVRDLQLIEWTGAEQKLSQILSLNHMQTASKQLSV